MIEKQIQNTCVYVCLVLYCDCTKQTAICQYKNNRKEVQILNSEKRIDEQARAARAAYFREWRRKNPDKVRENNRKYWQRRAARLAAEKEAQKRED